MFKRRTGSRKNRFCSGTGKSACYEGDITLYHFDVYRIQDEEEMYEIGYEEYVYSDAVSVIEWAENIKEILPGKRYEITIEKDYDKHEDYRRITIERKGE